MMRSLLLKASLILMLSFSLSAQYSYHKVAPNVEVATRTEAIIQLINSKNRSKIRNYIKKHFDTAWQQNVEESVNYFLFSAQSYGELKLHSYRNYQPTLPVGESVAILYSEHMESWVAATTIVEKNKISIFDISPAKPPTDQIPAKPISEKEASAEIKNYLKRTKERGHFSGNVIVARDQDILVEQSFGEASKRFGVRNRASTRFNLASVSKMFVGMAIGILVDRDKLNLDDPVSNYLSDQWMRPEKAKQTTIRHLLSHQSGLGNSTFTQIQNLSKSQPITKAELRRLVRDEVSLFTAGESYAYSNTAIILVGAIIEEVTKQPFDQFIKQTIFQPLNMDQSGYFDLATPIKDIATGYERDFSSAEQWFNNHFQISRNATAAGGAYSTTRDMVLFLRALHSNTLLKPATAKYIKQLYQWPGHPWINHSGLDYGAGTHVDLHESKGYIIVTLSNYTNGAVAVSAKIRSILDRVE